MRGIVIGAGVKMQVFDLTAQTGEAFRLGEVGQCHGMKGAASTL